MFNKLLNIAIAVNDIEAAVARYEQAFGWTLDGEIGTLPALGIRNAMLTVGEVSIELISPLPGETVLRRFLDTRGEGLYRLAFGSSEIDKDLARLDENNVGYVNLPSSDGGRIVMTRPSAAHGLMVELLER